jgi:hypothetical protein
MYDKVFEKVRYRVYRLKIKNSVFTIQKENIALLAFIKAQDNGEIIDPKDKEGGIKYLESIGFEVSDVE